MDKLYLAEETIEGIKRIKDMDIVRRKKDLKVLNMSVEEGAKLLVSAGLLSPDETAKPDTPKSDTPKPAAHI